MPARRLARRRAYGGADSRAGPTTAWMRLFFGGPRRCDRVGPRPRIHAHPVLPRPQRSSWGRCLGPRHRAHGRGFRWLNSTYGFAVGDSNLTSDTSSLAAVADRGAEFYSSTANRMSPVCGLTCITLPSEAFVQAIARAHLRLGNSRARRSQASDRELGPRAAAHRSAIGACVVRAATARRARLTPPADAAPSAAKEAPPWPSPADGHGHRHSRA